MTWPRELREPVLASGLEADAIKKLAGAIGAERPLPKLVAADGEAMPIPESVCCLLSRILELMAADKAVSLQEFNRELHTWEAAYILDVPDVHLMKLLESGEIPYHEDMYSQRRIWFEDLMVYKRKWDMKRHEGLRELTQLSQEWGLYDDGVFD